MEINSATTLEEIQERMDSLRHLYLNSNIECLAGIDKEVKEEEKDSYAEQWLALSKAKKQLFQLEHIA